MKSFFVLLREMRPDAAETGSALKSYAALKEGICR